jgi:Asp-tRNA(Asn)/Glu-tRNA(Gln) amidotransferase A subunit family amidase
MSGSMTRREMLVRASLAGVATALDPTIDGERHLDAFFARFDIVLTPTLAVPPVHNGAGNAAMSVPLGA